MSLALDLRKDFCFIYVYKIVGVSMSIQILRRSPLFNQEKEVVLNFRLIDLESLTTGLLHRNARLVSEQLLYLLDIFRVRDSQDDIIKDHVPYPFGLSF